MLIDSHAHLNFESFENDWQQVIADCQKQDVWLINVGSQLETSRRAVEIAERYEQGVYAAVGLHPIHVAGGNFQSEEFKVENYKNLIQNHKKVVAIGETGIDFFHDDKNFLKQKEVFLQHLDLAREFNRPVIIHCRNSQTGQLNAYEKILAVFKDDKSEVGGVIHCYGGNLDQAQEFLDLGFYLGFTGIITFKKTEALAEVIKATPLEKILIETDAPYLAPEPHRGERNLPQYVEFVGGRIAEIKGLNYKQVEEQTVQNARNLFKI